MSCHNQPPTNAMGSCWIHTRASHASLLSRAPTWHSWWHQSAGFSQQPAEGVPCARWRGTPSWAGPGDSPPRTSGPGVGSIAKSNGQLAQIWAGHTLDDQPVPKTECNLPTVFFSQQSSPHPGLGIDEGWERKERRREMGKEFEEGNMSTLEWKK